MIPVNARSTSWVCDHSLVGIAGSNPAGAWMLLCFNVVSSQVEVFRRGRSLVRGVLWSVCLCHCAWSGATVSQYISIE
jgi:hypothetical protein